jgi:peptidoglycan/LPS O-acetylase OafA/YrhL
MNYRKEIDGLRAVAVMSVVLFHAGIAGFPGGYVGVDVFFVISGYLITTIIMNDMSAGTYSIAGFYERRAKRILPALAVVILATLPFVWFWMMPKQLEAFAKSLAATVSFVSNFYFRDQINYFATAADEQPLLHTWSLAVEEQFYLFMPVLLLTCRRLGVRRLLWLVIALAVISFVVAQRGTVRHPEGNFFEFKSRIWELMVGSILAMVQLQCVLRDRVSLSVASVLSWSGLLAIIAAVGFFDEQTPMPSAWALLPTVGAALFIAFASADNSAGKLLGSKWPVAIGLISYSVYLWHFPVFALARIRFEYHNDDLLLATIMILLTLLLAFCSYRWVEQPCRKATVPQRKVFAMVGGGMAFMLMIAMTGFVGKGFPGRLNDEQLARLKLIADAQSEVMFDNGRCIFNGDNITEVFKNRFMECVQQYKKAVMIIGDSHGRDMYNALASNTNRPFVVGVTHHGCRPQIEKPECQYKQVSEFVQLHAEQIEVVLFNQAGQHFLRHETMLPFKKDEIEKAQDYLLHLASFTRLVWIGPQAEPDVDLQNMNILFRAVTAKDATTENKLIYAVDEFLENSNREKSIEYISTLRTLQYVFNRDFFIEGMYTYADKHHWSSEGERYFGKRLLADTTLNHIFISNNNAVLKN